MRVCSGLSSKVAEISYWQNQYFISCREDAEAAVNGDGGGGGSGDGQARQGPHTHAAQGGSRPGNPSLSWGV